MVRVLLYHHFGSQDVLGTDDEPVALYCTFDKVILAFIQIDESLQGVCCCCFLLPANEVAGRYCFYTCFSVRMVLYYQHHS